MNAPAHARGAEGTGRTPPAWEEQPARRRRPPGERDGRAWSAWLTDVSLLSLERALENENQGGAVVRWIKSHVRGDISKTTFSPRNTHSVSLLPLKVTAGNKCEPQTCNYVSALPPRWASYVTLECYSKIPNKLFE